MIVSDEFEKMRMNGSWPSWRYSSIFLEQLTKLLKISVRTLFSGPSMEPGSFRIRSRNTNQRITAFDMMFYLYEVLHHRMRWDDVHERWVSKNLTGSGHGLFLSVPLFSWKYWGQSQTSIVRNPIQMYKVSRNGFRWYVCYNVGSPSDLRLYAWNW